MKQRPLKAIALMFLLIAAAPCFGQLGQVMRKVQDKVQQAKDKANKANDVASTYVPWSPEQESLIGQASAAKLINIFGLYENPDMTKYVNLVGNAVARQSHRAVPYHFAILDTEIVTAVSLPGGFVFITRGALANISKESELAGVLAHEVAHVEQRHLEKEIRAQKSVTYVKEQVGSRLPSEAELNSLTSDIIGKSLTLKVSRDKETDADRLGLQFGANAGYDPAGLRNFLESLNEAAKTPESNRQLALWGSTHPPLPERIASLDALLPNYPAHGQELAERYKQHINPEAFNGGPGAK